MLKKSKIGDFMKKVLLYLLILFFFLIAFNYTIAPSHAKNEDRLINFVKKGKTFKIKLSDIDKHCEYGLAEKLIKIILHHRERILEKPCFNPEIDVTDKDAMLKDGKTILNQTTYLRKAGIDPKTMNLSDSENDTINKTLESSFMVYYTSLVDIDSDGESEIRFYSVQGSLLEEDNYFFKKGRDGRYKLVECKLGGGDMLIFIKYDNKVYMAERNKENILNYLIIYSFDPVDEKFKNLFTINIERKGKKGKNITLTLDI